MSNQKWISVNGVVVRGYGIASGQSGDNPYPTGTIEMQVPVFKKLGLDLSSFFRGTLNISISPYTFSVTRPEFTFPNVQWTNRHQPEHFSFSRCQVTFRKIKYAGWVYYPHPETKTRHFQDSSIIEVIAPLIANLKYGDPIKISVNPDEILLEK